jgi:hypothetical protein
MNRELLRERDARIFEQRKAGLPIAKIAANFGISTRAVGAAVDRMLQKLNRDALLGAPELLRMELERLDSLQQAIWPMTQHRKVKLDDGTIVALEPDMKAVAEVRALMAQRIKLLGMEQIQVNIGMPGENTPQRASLAGAEKPAEVTAFNPETEARQLLEIMGVAGVLPSETIDQILGRTALPSPDLDDVIDDAEIIIPDEVIP